MNWVIMVGGGYGAFLFQGSIADAEVKRIDKARWERAPARKRLADEEEVRNGVASNCMNHPGFGDKVAYIDCPCDDENCVVDAQERYDAARRSQRSKP